MIKNNLNHIPDTSKVWIFASPKSISKDISAEILTHIDAFLKQWKAHGKELKSFKEFIDGHFLIIAVDESFEQATGCSIDSMVHFIAEIEKKYQINFTDRSLVYYRLNEEVKSTNFLNIKELVHSGEIDENTPVYNNSIINGKQLKSEWIETAAKTWLKKYFQNSSVG